MPVAVTINRRRVIRIRRPVIGAGTVIVVIAMAMAVAVPVVGGERRNSSEDTENGGNRSGIGLSTLMRQWQDKVEPALLERLRPFTPGEIALKGKHPKFEVAGAEVPKACLTCHARTSKAAPPLGRMLHGLHLVGGEKNHFLTQFQGECTHCHRLETATGKPVRVKVLQSVLKGDLVCQFAVHLPEDL